ncbi:MAG: C69 family dipeptidase [Candidatus Hydrogenedentes bacterium]|nr:C69 family dipeptidase [Candidatus Hydrogenedentota bacterium]
MCDTIAVVESGRVLFAKNSDRDANEGQNIEWHPRRLRSGDAPLQCTYIEIPEVEETNATLISRPFWMWGAEIGANEHGVTIGNEAVFTKAPLEKKPGLLGMDLLRLALERASTAEEACGVITELLETYGQGGGCGYENRKFTYHNSFIVADPAEAFVLETAGRAWVTERIAGARSISNGLSIPGFAEQHSDPLKTRISACPLRSARTLELAKQSSSVEGLMRALADHGPSTDAANGDVQPVRYSPVNGAMSAPCVHGGGIVTSSQTTSSWVAELRPGDCLHWVTATAAPCTSLFKPVRVDKPIDLGKPSEDRANDSLWWTHERFHRNVMKNPSETTPLFMAERDAIQQRWIDDPPSGEAAFTEAATALRGWTQAVEERGAADIRPMWTRRYWAKRNRLAGLGF